MARTSPHYRKPMFLKLIGHSIPLCVMQGLQVGFEVMTYSEGAGVHPVGSSYLLLARRSIHRDIVVVQRSKGVVNHD